MVGRKKKKGRLLEGRFWGEGDMAVVRNSLSNNGKKPSHPKDDMQGQKEFLVTGPTGGRAVRKK